METREEVSSSLGGSSIQAGGLAYKVLAAEILSDSREERAEGSSKVGSPEALEVAGVLHHSPLLALLPEGVLQLHERLVDIKVRDALVDEDKSFPGVVDLAAHDEPPGRLDEVQELEDESDGWQSEGDVERDSEGAFVVDVGESLEGSPGNESGSELTDIH